MLQYVFGNVTAIKSATLSKRDSNRGVFLRILQNYSEQLFCRSLQVTSSEILVLAMQQVLVVESAWIEDVD